MGKNRGKPCRVFKKSLSRPRVHYRFYYYPLLGTGFEAEKFLLDGAELMHHASAQTILYRKQGTLHMAIWDFHYLNQVDAKYFQGTDRVRTLTTEKHCLHIGNSFY